MNAGIMFGAICFVWHTAFLWGIAP